MDIDWRERNEVLTTVFKNVNCELKLNNYLGKRGNSFFFPDVTNFAAFIKVISYLQILSPP